MFLRKKISKDMSVAKIISSSPKARSVMSEHGIKFIGKDLSPLESLEKVAKGNGLNSSDIDKMLAEINKQPEQASKNVIELTDSASVQLRDLIKAKQKKGIRLRLVSDGCSTYVYDMDFGTKRVGDEIETKANGIRFFIEKKSVDFINGTKIDYDNIKEGFVFANPNVKN